MGRCAAFTLIELLVVVVVLGVVASLTMPRISRAAETSERTAFATDLRQFAKAAQLFQLEHGTYLEDADSGKLPVGFDDYIRAEDWTGGTPLGGVWDAELDEHSVTSAIGVHFKSSEGRKDDAYMTHVDALLDDGDLNTGGFRKIASKRYYLILAP